MSHGRKQIRDAVLTLITGLETTGTNVSATRHFPVDVVPWAIVWMPTEDIMAERSPIGQKIRRELSFVIEGKFKPPEGGGEPEDQADDFCEEVEQAISADPTMGQKAQAVELQKTSFEWTGEMERPACIATMIWRVVWYSTAQAPGTILPS